MKNTLFRILPVLLPLVAFAGGEQGMHYVDRATNEFAIAYSVAFDAGQKPESVVYYHYSQRPDEPEAKWYKSRVCVSFAGAPVVNGRTTGESGCVPLLNVGALEGGKPAPGEKRRVEIVHRDGFIAVYQEVKGKMVLCARTGISSWERLRAVSFEPGKGTVTDVKITTDGKVPRQGPVRETLPLPTAYGASVRFGVRTQIHPGQIRLVVQDGSAKPPVLVCSTFNQTFDQKLKVKEKKEENGVPVFREVTESKRHTVADTGLEIAANHWDKDCVYSITRIGGRYRGDQMTEILAHLGDYGRHASQHAFLFEIRRGDAGCELWVDHNFVRLLPASAQAVVRCRVDPANSREAR